jgi:hypothetical protein
MDSNWFRGTEMDQNRHQLSHEPEGEAPHRSRDYRQRWNPRYSSFRAYPPFTL